MTQINENSSRSRRKFFKYAFASIAVSTTGIYSLKAKASYPSFDGEKEAIRITKL